ncbi:unnamed protein product [Anisakis simplex]|uniref:DUF655 domain-containing protein n=1 Tax=Anisakis simplex TaxID=6269 RepID=A0A0M3JJR5_ANISI|nr:unnamed protein product [Anisakis simplex]
MKDFFESVQFYVPLTPDFFVPGAEYEKPLGASQGSEKLRGQSRKAMQEVDIRGVLEGIKTIINPEMVAKMKAVYQFTLKSGKSSVFFFG